jgi:hypothetical protein
MGHKNGLVSDFSNFDVVQLYDEAHPAPAARPYCNAGIYPGGKTYP